MMGGSIDDEKTKGMTPRLVQKIFDTVETAPSTLEFTVRVSFMEIYMERIRDLLKPHNDNLPVHEDKQRGVYVKGLQEIYVSSVHEVLEVMRIGDQSRAVSSTSIIAPYLT
jgi:kinesin family member 5